MCILGRSDLVSPENDGVLTQADRLLNPFLGELGLPDIGRTILFKFANVGFVHWKQQFLSHELSESESEFLVPQALVFM